MTHEYEGHYRAKHGPNTQLDSTLAERIREKATEGRLTCAAAFTIAEKTGASPAEVGRATDLVEIKVTKCQLGLFGHGKGVRNIVEPARKVSAELEAALRGGLVNGRVPCKTAWDLARRFGVSKTEITAACEKLNIRLGLCQLGTF